jgi:hypothetical protein
MQRTKPELHLIGAPPTDETLPAPQHLAGVGLELWHRITREFEFSEPASYAVLREACFAVYRADRCRALIDRDGELLHVGKLVRSNPLLRDEIQNRALAARLLRQLRLDEVKLPAMSPAPHPRGR